MIHPPVVQLQMLRFVWHTIEGVDSDAPDVAPGTLGARPYGLGRLLWLQQRERDGVTERQMEVWFKGRTSDGESIRNRYRVVSLIAGDLPPLTWMMDMGPVPRWQEFLLWVAVSIPLWPFWILLPCVVLPRSVSGSDARAWGVLLAGSAHIGGTIHLMAAWCN